MWSKPWPSWTKLAFARRHPSPELGGGRWPSAPSWCRSCAGTWSGSPNPAREALSSSAPKGRRLRRSNFREHWHKAREAVELPDLHFHDLRHTGGTLSAATGATLKELMARLGHSSVRAAMIYQHATWDRD